MSMSREELKKKLREMYLEYEDLNKQYGAMTDGTEEKLEIKRKMDYLYNYLMIFKDVKL